MAVTRDVGLDPAKVNPNGSGSARPSDRRTGCILTVKAIYELHRTGKRYALVTMCIGGARGSRRFSSACDVGRGRGRSLTHGPATTQDRIRGP